MKKIAISSYFSHLIKKLLQTWNDMKKNAKKKLTTIRQNANRTGAGPSNINMDPFEDRVIGVCGIDTLDGDQNIDEIGVPSKWLLVFSESVFKKE